MAVPPVQLEKLDHVIVMTLDLDRTKAFFEDIFASEFSRLITQESPVWDLREVAGDGLDICAPLHPDGNMAKSIKGRGEGLGALGLKVADLEVADREMQKRGVRQATKYANGDFSKIFYHPKDCFGVLLNLRHYPPRVGAEWKKKWPPTTMERIDQVMIMVSDLEKAAAFFADLFGLKFSERIEVKEPAFDLLARVGGCLKICTPLCPDGRTVKSLK